MGKEFSSLQKEAFFLCENEMHLQRLVHLYPISLYSKEKAKQQQNTNSLLERFSILPVSQISNSLEAQLGNS